MNPQAAQQCFQKLSALLSRQIGEIDGIISYLGEIKDAIATNEIESLNTLLSQQRLPTEDINNLEIQRHQLLNDYGFEFSQQGLEKCISKCDENGVLGEKYEQFQQVLSRLQRSIQVNSLLINKNKNRIRTSLHLLTGQQNSDSTKTYSSTGHTSGYSSKRSLAQA